MGSSNLVHKFINGELETEGFVELISWEGRRKENKGSEVKSITVKLTFLTHTNT